MQNQSNLAKIKSLVIEILKYDKKKLILPGLMICLLVSSLMYGSYLRDQANKDQKIIDQFKDENTNYNEARLELEYFPNQTEYNNTDEIETQNKDNRITRTDQVLLMPFIATETVLYPLNPKTIGSLHASSLELSYPSINPENGYVWSKEYIAGGLEIYYYAKEYSKLDQDLNSSNISFEEYKNRANSIKSEEYGDGEIAETVIPFNQSGYSTVSLFESSDISEERLYELIENDEFTEVQLIHFIPTILSTFLMYYILSGMILIGWRESKKLLMGMLNATEDRN